MEAGRRKVPKALGAECAVQIAHGNQWLCRLAFTSLARPPLFRADKVAGTVVGHLVASLILPPEPFIAPSGSTELLREAMPTYSTEALCAGGIETRRFSSARMA